MDPLRTDVRVIEPRTSQNEVASHSSSTAELQKVAAKVKNSTQRKDVAGDTTRTDAQQVNRRQAREQRQSQQENTSSASSNSNKSTSNSSSSVSSNNNDPAARTNLSRARVFQTNDLSGTLDELRETDNQRDQESEQLERDALVNDVNLRRAQQAYQLTDPVSVSDENQPRFDAVSA